MGRSQFVTVRNSSSASAEVFSGVPQGLVLGPLLFILHINDLLSHVKSNIQMFADDTKICFEIDSANNAMKIQDDLEELHCLCQNGFLDSVLGRANQCTLEQQSS